MHRAALLSMLSLALLLTVPAAAADHESSRCTWDMPVIDMTQCVANAGIDLVEHEAQATIRAVCIIVFGEPC